MKFDLESSIRLWRNKLRSKSSFEDGDIEELEDHFRSKIDDLHKEGFSHEEAFNIALKNDYPDLDLLGQSYKEERKMKRHFTSLLTNFIKVGFRSIHRHSQYSLINILGLSVGFACVFGIVVYLSQEYSFDHFHENGDEIYRVNFHMNRASGNIHYPIIPPAFGPEFKANFPEAKQVTRLRYAYPIVMKHEQNSFFEDRVFFAEQTFLEMFNFPLTIGNRTSALSQPNTILVTERIAEKYFGSDSPMGKIIRYNNEIDLEVTGVLENIPENAHLEFDFLISFETFKPGPGALEPMTSWSWLGFLTYVQLYPEANIPEIEAKASALFQSNNMKT